jgi:FkbH-like protein
VYEFDWANEALWTREAAVNPVQSSLPHQRVAETLLVHWEEHCMECAPPHCYTVCPLYVARGDHRCARFVYGVYPHPSFQGLLNRGADVRFRRWGKIETRLSGRMVSVERHRRLDRFDAVATRLVSATSKALTPLTKRQRLNAKWAHLRGSLLFRPDADGERYDDFVLECHVPEERPFRLLLERLEDGVPTLRHAFEVGPGHNLHTLPADVFGRLGGGRVRIYPEDDGEHRVIFTWLDFVRYAQLDGRPAEKVKVLCWDLDNTLWKGTLLEDGEDGCRLREGTRELIEALDARGILQTIVSKNDHDHAWAQVGRLGLQNYFLYPAINWGQKSESVRQIAQKLNLGLDSFAIVDDSPFERAEVQSALPMVRVYSEEQLFSLIELPEFDVPVTEMSATRRFSYLTEIDRSRATEQFRGDYRAFVRSCELRMRIFVPRAETEIRRCLELVQRSNQLNLSARRYSEPEFAELLSTPGILPLAFEAEDRFGQYGIVGFASVDERADVPVVRDFVLSCRIAGKYVEPTFFQWLAVHEHRRAAAALRAELTRTQRNRPLVQVLEELPFKAVQKENGRELLEMRLGASALDDLIAVHAEL